MIEDLGIGQQAVEAVVERRDDIDRLRQGEAAHVARRPLDRDSLCGRQLARIVDHLGPQVESQVLTPRRAKARA